ncbi:MAG: DUF488 family protein, partial [Dolichospermum sp.]
MFNHHLLFLYKLLFHFVIAATEAFKVGLNRLIQGSEKYQISLMCAEQDPIVCHR